jgi:aconitate hydratase
MADYLRATERKEIAQLAEGVAQHLMADPEVIENPEEYYDEIVEINLSELEPHIVGPHTPDLARPVSQMKADAEKNEYPMDISAALIGSCTNSSYEDIGRAAHIARQVKAAGGKARIPFMVTPGSEQVRATIERDGLLADLEAVGATVLANACGPCIGQWDRVDSIKDEPNSILTSYNRNFPRRNDGSPTTNAFIGSPEVVTAYAFTGSFDVNPLTQGIKLENGETIKLEPPTADELPAKGFDHGDSGYRAPEEDGSSVAVEVAADSERLSLLESFEPLDKVAAYQDLPVLIKASGKCTTDHISPAGPWLKYRGHLDRISDNMFSGANNAFGTETGTGYNVFTEEENKPLNEIARDYKARGQGWVTVGDENLGEGSSREHAAMSPRHLGCRVVLTRSFARIHQTNLKKQGILPLTFSNPADYDKIRRDDRLSFTGLDNIAPGSMVVVTITHAEGGTETIEAQHTLTKEQVEWFNAGSALNLIRQQQA